MKLTENVVGQIMTGLLPMDAVTAPIVLTLPGDRIRGNVRMVTIRPVLQTGQRQGLMPVMRSKRSIEVSSVEDSFKRCFSISRFSNASMSGLSSGTNLSERFRLSVWL
ncbi:MAG: hypothetical protein PHQ26_10495 [Bacteroidales bacterium]|nr:hypothetical protein [Bacteroidales bacterium]